MKIDVLKVLADGTQTVESRQVAADFFEAALPAIDNGDERVAALEEKVNKMFDQLSLILQKLV